MDTLHIPSHCGVMQLPDCTLFPQGGLPLNIFEPRYRKMLEDALEGDCIFAVARVRDNDGVGQVSEIGTVGLIRASKEHKNGTSELVLHGVIRVRFVEWLEEKIYPYALIEPILPEPMDEGKAAAALKTLKGSVEDSIIGLPQEVQKFIIHIMEQTQEPGLLADIVAQHLVLDANFRQELLETTHIGERVSMLCEFFEKLRPV